MVNLSENATKQFKLYSFQGETIEDTFHRVSNEFTKKPEDHEIAYNLLEQNIWRPNTPVFLNAGTDHKVFSACYVTGLEDSMEGIFDVANIARKIFQFGAGIGIPIGNLRESNAYIYEGSPDIPPEGRSSGPKVFMNLYDVIGFAVKSGGRTRRAAIMCNIPIWHPDNIDFIKSKIEDGYFSNMNISVNITDKFMQSLKDKIPFSLHTPYDGSKVGEIDPNEVWDLIAECNHMSGDPGVIFIDRMNEYNPLIAKHMIEATNPCGEQPLIPYGCCNLSAINLAKFVNPDRTFDWKKLSDTTFIIMGLMDNIIDNMEFPEECSIKNSNVKYHKKDRFRIMAEKYRPIGIGPMGLGDALYLQDIKYDSVTGREFAAEVMRIMTSACVKKSALLAKEHGTFFQYNIHKENMERIISEHIGYDEGYEDSKKIFDLVKEYGVRNIQFTTCQPTGCLVENTLISGNSFGVSKIGNMEYKTIPTKTKSDNGEYTYKNWYPQGKANTIKIITNHGYELQGTYDHKVKVINENGYIWKTLNNINENDYVVMRKNFITDEGNNMVGGNPNCDKLIFPSEIAEFIGYYMADGWWTVDNRNYGRLYLSVNKKDKKYVNGLLNNLKKWFIFNKKERNETETYFRYDIPCTEMYNFFKDKGLIKEGAENAFIPSFIMGNRNNLFSFIKGYFKGDGCITERDKEFCFTTISKKMAKSLQTILLGLGFPSRLSYYPVEEGQTIEICGREVNCNYDVYKIYVNNHYSSKLGNKINEKIDFIHKNTNEKIIITGEEEKLFGGSVLPSYHKKIKEPFKYVSFNNYIKKGNGNWFWNNELYIDKIKTKEYYESELVYDMEIEENGHTYIANGFVTHNTTALSCDASYGIEPIFGLTFDKNYVTGETVTLINEIFYDKFKNEKWFKHDFIERIHKNEGSLKGIHGIPQNVRETFIVAHDIKYTDRIDMQAAIQKYCSTAISSTVNLSKDTTKEEISEIYKYAYEKKLKGITIYRDGSKKNQPITFTKENQVKMLKRPAKLPSFVHKIETGNGQMYVTVSEYQGKPLEVFVNLGKSGQILNTLTEALSRVMSIALQQGVPLEEITKTLVGINSDKPTWFRFEDSDARPTQILSIPDGLAKLLERYYSGIKLDEEIKGEPCPKCGLSMKAIEGCFTCTSCGHSNCS